MLKHLKKFPNLRPMMFNSIRWSWAAAKHRHFRIDWEGSTILDTQRVLVIKSFVCWTVLLKATSSHQDQHSNGIPVDHMLLYDLWAEEFSALKVFFHTLNQRLWRNSGRQMYNHWLRNFPSGTLNQTPGREGLVRNGAILVDFWLLSILQKCWIYYVRWSNRS